MEIKDYVKLFQEAFSLTQNEQAAVMIVEQYCLDKRTEFISNQREQSKKQDSVSPASSKQMEFLRKLMKEKKIEVRDISKITKQEANNLIREALK